MASHYAGRYVILLTLTMVALSGCRMYGGYDSKEITFAQIQTSLERYEARATRLEADHAFLMEAAREDGSLSAVAGQFEELVDAQKLVLEGHAKTAASVADTRSYRRLNRALGSMIAEQQVIEDRFARLVDDMLPDSYDLLDREDPSRYSIVPVYYARIEANLAKVTVRDAVRAD